MPIRGTNTRRAFYGASASLGESLRWNASDSVVPTGWTLTRTATSPASPGTYFDSSGVLQTAAVNLLQYSRYLQTAPNAQYQASPVFITKAWPGGIYMTKIQDNGNTDVHLWYQTSIPITSGTSYKYSIYVSKNSAYSTIFLQIYNVGSTKTLNAIFNFDSGTFTSANATGAGATLGGTSVEDVGNNVYRLTVWGSITDTSVTMAVYNNGGNTYTGTGLGALIAGGMVVAGTGAETSTLIETINAVGAAPRRTYNPSTLALRGTMVEQAATNLCVRSNAFTTAPWVAIGTPASTQNLTGPDGTTSGWSVTDDSAVATEQYQFADVLTAATYTDSVFIKKTTGAQTGYPVLAVNNSTLLAACTVDTTNGVATIWTAYTGFTITTSSCRIEDCGNWWRVSLTYLADADAGGWQKYVMPAGASTANKSTGTLDVAATATHGFFGFQRELGSAATSYIATGAASATRNADVLTAPTSGLLVNAQGFAAMSFEQIVDGSGAGIAALFSSFASGGGIPLGYDSGNLQTFDGTAWRVGAAFLPAAGSTYAVASTWGVDIRNAADGTVSGSLTFDGSMDLGATLRIGDHVSGASAPISLYLKSLRLGVARLSSGELRTIV